MTDHDLFIRAAIAAAQAAVDKGNHPFGSVLVDKGEVVLRAENTVISTHDVTRHAELVLVSAASKRFSGAELSEMTLYTSTEPCAMCAGAMVWAGIRRMVYACGAQALADVAGSPFVLPSREVFSYVSYDIEVIGPVLEEEALAQHRAFW